MSQTFTLDELARFDGKEGRPAYAAVDGTVYDLSGSPRWPKGEHITCDLGARAGRDVSDEITFAPSYMRSMLASMPAVGILVQVARRANRARRTGLVALFVILIAVPFVAMSLAGFRANPASWTYLRMAALETFTLLFADIMIGALRPLLTRVFSTRVTHRAHQWIGVVAFALAISHGTTVFLLGTAGYPWRAVWVGPSVLTLLTVVVVTAFTRRKLSGSWRWIHRVNYLLFAAALVHASYLGYNVRSQMFVRIVFYVYAAAVAASLGYRIYLLVRRGRIPPVPVTR
jgi:predicted heme/steroid binding protein/DMSO/TMAO reductase YedYZ heme-binding membrane subunit